MYGKTNAGTGGIKMVKLWENASPTSEFAAQDLPIEGAGYTSKFPLLLITGTSVSCIVPNKIGAIGKMSTAAPGTDAAYPDHRKFTIGTNIVSVDVNYAGYIKTSSITRNVANTLNIPLAIYGIKGVK